MKIVIPGGTGQIGTILARSFHTAGHEVVVLSRSNNNLPWRSVKWDGESIGAYYYPQIIKQRNDISLGGKAVE
jgi:uncharacterized protein